MNFATIRKMATEVLTRFLNVVARPALAGRRREQVLRAVFMKRVVAERAQNQCARVGASAASATNLVQRASFFRLSIPKPIAVAASPVSSQPRFLFSQSWRLRGWAQ